MGKASSMVAVALCPKPGWKVLDACAAPGNKTSHLAALMKGKGKIIACEINKKRLVHLDDTIRRSGAHNVEIIHCDFLDINASDRSFSKVRAILLDPSCSGSGTSAERLDHLLPSYSTDHQDEAAANGPRVRKLAAFQKKALAHALSFPAVERVVYSTCSIHQTENEDVVESVLPLATSLGFELATPFPQWPLRGRPIFDGAERLLRTDPSQDTEGFFIALFVKKLRSLPPAQKKHFSPGRKLPFFPTKISKIWMRHCMARRRRRNS
ncbi:probable 28S rRNA (cytosine-C(5))-methyltransferase [Dendrobium catenatum]|uniref:probable 28S rRNA (cytosine-C(5))-methyltransferase n=1 Tax=Dendrobium catenatum TaxID=906689 RepID=UPI0009F3D145|nr:probable 28S rRNA (cytosine-C(5))-methyltransferase [Dendrobium catenatum]